MLNHIEQLSRVICVNLAESWETSLSAKENGFLIGVDLSEIQMILYGESFLSEEIHRSKGQSDVMLDS